MNVIIRRNIARTAWLVVSGTAPELCGAANIVNFCASKRQAVEWCAANGYVVAT